MAREQLLVPVSIQTFNYADILLVGSTTSSRRPPPTEAYSEINENDEWAAIQKFNTLLHFEEQKQAMIRDMERKRLIREQLAQQIEDKNNKNANMQDEDRMYH